MSMEVWRDYPSLGGPQWEIARRALWAQNPGKPAESWIAERLNKLPVGYVSPDADDLYPGAVVIVAVRDTETGEIVVAPMQPTSGDKILQSISAMAYRLAEISGPEGVDSIEQVDTGVEKLKHSHFTFMTGLPEPTPLTSEQLGELDALFNDLFKPRKFDI